MALKDLLREREQEIGAPLRVGLVGAGQMGAGLMSQIEKMVGMRVVAVADVMPDRAKAAYGEADVDAHLVVKEELDPVKAGKAIRDGKRVASHSSDLIANIPEVDVVVECTGVPEVGAVVCQQAILAGKHIVNMNVETDCTIGYYLASMAKPAGTVYTLTTGDEPGTVKEIYDFADALGFEIYMIGKGKNNPLDVTANPTTVAARAKEQMMSPKMLASFVDGTKTMVEMTAMGNGTGYKPEVRGAHGPKVAVKDLAKVFSPKENGGIMGAPGAVDYALGDVAPGVFVVITTDQPKIVRDLKYLHLNGYGNFWALYRPYHLANLETPIAIARAFLYGEETLATHQPPVCETVAMAKKDLCIGDKIDALGGYTVYGSIERADVAKTDDLLPLGLSVGAVMKRDVKQGEPLHYSDVDLDESQTIFHLRKLQDKMVAAASKK